MNVKMMNYSKKVIPTTTITTIMDGRQFYLAANMSKEKEETEL